jgi:hypothetical protein
MKKPNQLQLHPALAVLLSHHAQPRLIRFLDPDETCVSYDFAIDLQPWYAIIPDNQIYRIAIDLADKGIVIRIMQADTCKEQIRLEFGATLTEIELSIESGLARLTAIEANS